MRCCESVFALFAPVVALDIRAVHMDGTVYVKAKLITYDTS